MTTGQICSRVSRSDRSARRVLSHLTVTPAEHRKIKRAADRRGQAVSAWARERILAGLPRS